MGHIVRTRIHKIRKIFFFVGIFLLVSTLSLSAEKTGTLEALILSWSEARKSCDFETNASRKDSHCDTQLQYEQALKAKGFCRGADTLKLENDTERDNPLYKDQYEVFEKIVRNKWVPCVFKSLLENKEEAFNTHGIEKQHWLEANEDESFNINIYFI